ncbi:MAG: hypothetical protein KatS3mg051_1031 [Anaerolineae bacterium]|nr:MAG: hypothetical protein KatS3mg051_1031 [Anaerolineae bacterium]
MQLIIDRTRVDLLMRRAGIESYADLAARAGVHENTLLRVLKGHNWTSETAAKLAAALNCNPIDLMTAEGYPDPNWEPLAVP